MNWRSCLWYTKIKRLFKYLKVYFLHVNNIFSFVALQPSILVLHFFTSYDAAIYYKYNQVQAICLPRVTSIIRLEEVAATADGGCCLHWSGVGDRWDCVTMMMMFDPPTCTQLQQMWCVTLERLKTQTYLILGFPHTLCFT